jgi:hypothetical protein
MLYIQRRLGANDGDVCERERMRSDDRWWKLVILVLKNIPLCISI